MITGYLQFIDPTLDTSLIYQSSYSPVLVGLSVLIAIAGSYAMFYLAPSINAAPNKLGRTFWVVSGAVAMGVSIWAMHFIGMLALSLPCGISYDPALTLLSMIPGMIASGVAVWFVTGKKSTRVRRLAASLLLGGGIGTMHYTGMAAMHIQGVIRYSPGMFGLSLVVAILLAFVALEVRSAIRETSRWPDIACSVVMGLAVSGMHYTAMAAAYFIKGDAADQANSVFTPNTLAIIVTAMTFCFVAFSLEAGYVAHQVRARLRSFAKLPRAQIVPVLLLVTLVNLLVIGQAMFELSRSKDKHYQRAAITTQNLVATLSETLDNTLDNIDHNLIDAKAEIEHQLAHGKADAAGLESYLTRLRQRTPWVIGIRATDEQGWQKYGTDIPPGAAISIADRQYFQVQREDPHHGLYITQPIISRVNKVWVINLSLRLNYPDGSFAGVVFANVSLDNLSKIVSAVDVGRKGVILLRDSEMRTIMRYPMPEDFESILGKQKTSQEYQARMAAGERLGTYHSLMSFDGTPRTVGFHQVGKFPLMVTVELADQDFLAEWQHEVLQLSGMVLLVILVLTTGSWLLVLGWGRQLEMTQKLTASEEKFRTVADHTYNWEYWESPSREILFMSPACERVTGHRADEFIHRPGLIDAIIHPDDRHLFQKHRHSATEKLWSDITFRIVRPDGEIRWISHDCCPVFAQDHTYAGRRISNRDITDRKLAEEGFIAAGQLLDNIIENIPSMVFLKRASDLRFERFNRAGEALLGTTRDKLIGRNDYDLFPRQQADAFTEKDREVLQQQGVVDIPEEAIDTPNGTRILHTKKVALRDERDEPTYLLGLSEDITERLMAQRALETSELRFRNLFNSIGDAVLVHPLTDGHGGFGRFTEANAVACQRYGYSRQEFMAMTPLDLDQNDTFPTQEAIADAQATILDKRDFLFERVHVAKDGRRIPVEISSHIIDVDGVPTVMSMVRDISERKRAEAEYRSIIATTQDAFWITSAHDGHFIDVNPAACNMLGYSRDEMLQLSIPDIEAAQDAEEVARNSRRVRENGYARFESRHRCKDGHIIDVDVSVQNLEVRGGVFVVFIRDITERLSTERALQQSQERLKVATAAGVIGIWDWNIANNQLLWDDSMYRLYGIRAEDFAGAYEAWTRTLHPDDKSYIEVEIQAALNGEREYAPEFRVIWPDGSIHYLKAASHTEFDAHGKPTRMIGINYDLTEQKRAEQRAEAANQAKSSFLATMSHEIRTPLNAIIGTAYLLAQNQLTAEQKQDLATIETSSKNLLALINDVLDFSKIEAGELTIEAQDFSVNDLLQNMRTTFSKTAAAKGLQLRVSDAPAALPPLINGDGNRLRQMLINLIGNAVKFTSQGHVEVDVAMLAGDDNRSLSLRFKVADTGIGIREDALCRLFTPFTQGDQSTSRVYGGTGLGLSIVKRLAKLMGGDISVTSRYGEGSTFSLDLPFRLTDDALSSDTRVIEARKIDVLIAEDSLLDRRLMMQMCGRFGWNVEAVVNGREMLARVMTRLHQKHPIDCVLMDWRMPVMDGLEALAELNQQLGPRMPVVIMVTAQDLETFNRAVTDIKPDSVLVKPVGPSCLFNQVNRAIVAHTADLGYLLSGTQIVSGQSHWLQGLRILVVDDSELNLKMMERVLKLEGASPTCCSSGEAALAAIHLAGARFDLVLMDLQMPGMDGCETTRRIRADTQFSKLPVLALTAGATITEQARAMESGMNGFLSKPIDPVNLVRSIRQQVEKNRGQSLPLTPFHDDLLVARADQPAEQPEVGEVLHDWPRIEGIDHASLHAMLQGDTELLTTLLQLFVSENAQAGTEIQTLWNRRDDVQVAKRIHKVAGQAGNLCASELNRLGCRLEQMLLAREEGIDQSLRTFQADLAQLLQSIASYLGK